MDDEGGRMKLVVPEEIYHVVKVARPRPLGQSAHLLGEDFFVAVAPRHDPALGRIGVRMRDRAIDRRQGQHLVRCQIQLYSRQVFARWRNRPAIGHLPLRGRTVATVAENLERDLVRRKLDPGLFIDPGGEFPKCPDQEIEIEVGFIRQGEVKIFREAVSFEIALLEAGSAFEDSGFGKRGVIEDAGQDPAENVILFDDVGQKPKIAGCSEEFAAVNHARPPPPNSWESRGARL
jgi:hypothetical protein